MDTIMTKRRKLTPQEQRAAKAAYDIWLKRKDTDPTFTQTYVGEECGWSQGAVQQYFKGIIPMGANALSLLSRVLGAKPDEIYPELWNRITSTVEGANLPAIAWNNIRSRKKMTLVNSKTGKYEPVILPGETGCGPNTFKTEMIDGSMQQSSGRSIPIGAALVIDPDAKVNDGDVVIAVIKSVPVIGEYLKLRQILQPFNPQYSVRTVQARQIVGKVIAVSFKP